MSLNFKICLAYRISDKECLKRANIYWKHAICQVWVLILNFKFVRFWVLGPDSGSGGAPRALSKLSTSRWPPWLEIQRHFREKIASGVLILDSHACSAADKLGGRWSVCPKSNWDEANFPCIGSITIPWSASYRTSGLTPFRKLERFPEKTVSSIEDHQLH